MLLENKRFSPENLGNEIFELLESSTLLINIPKQQIIYGVTSHIAVFCV